MQLYISRKMDYLKKQNWTVLVYFYYTGDIKIPNLVEFQDNCIPPLRFCVGNVSSNTQLTILERIKENIGNARDIVIESCTFSLGTWGEFLAENLEGKHILYLINENIPTPTPLMKKFIEFKMRQNLFYCIKENVILDNFSEIINIKDFVLSAIGCSSSNVEDYSIEAVDSLPDEGNNILSLGRLDKSYMPHLFESIIEFTNRYPLKKFNFFVIGDAPNESFKKKLFSIIESQKNITLFYLGALWPIPKIIFKKAKVAVGSAGSIYLCSKQGIPSISIDSNDHEAIGIVTYNTNNILFRSNTDPSLSIVDNLEYILIKKMVTRLPEIDEKPLDYSQHQHIIDMHYNRNYFKTNESIHFVSYPRLRSLIIKFDQNSIGNRFINFFRKLNIFNSLLKRYN